MISNLPRTPADIRTTHERRPLDRTQSLADGDVARLLLTVELATTSQGSWDEVTDVLLRVTAASPDRSARAGLFYGAPALAFVLDATGDLYRARWAHELSVLDKILVDLAFERLEAAEARSASGAPVRGSEFDLLSGLTGLGVVLLRRVVRQPSRDEGMARALSAVLAYLVARAQDRTHGDIPVPGWWSADAPDPSVSGGSADFGMARGGAGILALLAAAFRAGYRVPAHAVAIRQITSWFTQWQQKSPDGVIWWPRRLTLEELRTRRIWQADAFDPTWAHGTPGIGRALQMAAIALGDEPARIAAEHAIGSCLTRSQLDPMTEPDLYAGTGGMYLTVLRAAEDAERFSVRQPGPSLLTHRLGVAADAVSRTSRALPDEQDTEFLWGRFGSRLVFESLRSRSVPVSGGDGVLGIGWAE